MITIFRKIRQKLIDSGSVTKYMFYAIGEILLVVIGILIALQVNNWNEERIETNQQYKIINRLQDEFQSNYKELLYDIDRLQEVNDALNLAIKVIDGSEQTQFTNEDITELVKNTVNDPTWNPSSFVLEDLKSNGQISSLKNNKLVDLLFSWERFYDNLIEFQDAFVASNNTYADYITEQGFIVNISNSAGITTSSSTVDILYMIKNDEKIYNLIHRKLIQSHFLMLEYKKTSDRLKEIIEVVN